MLHAMTDVIKPYKILSIQEYPDGKLISYEVSKRYLTDVDNVQHTEILRATAFAPLEADVDQFMSAHLTEAGWLI